MLFDAPGSKAYDCHQECGEADIAERLRAKPMKKEA
jgi:hypothetical protein